MKEATLLERKSKGGGKRASAAAPPPPSKADTGLDTGDLAGAFTSTPPEGKDESAMESMTETKTGGTIHVVKPGETLYRISRRYGVTVDKIKKWNKLPDEIIEVGQRLVVGQE